MPEREEILGRKVNGQQIVDGACLPITVTLIPCKLPYRVEMSFGPPLTAHTVNYKLSIGYFLLPTPIYL